MALDDQEEESQVPGSTPEDYAPAQDSSQQESGSPAPESKAGDFASLPEPAGNADIQNPKTLQAPIEPTFLPAGTLENDTYNYKLINDYDKQAASYDKQQAQIAYSQQKKAANSQARQDSQLTGRQYDYDENGIARPRVDPSTGQQAVVERRHPVQYDEQGRPYQVTYNPGGKPGKVIENPDADAKIGKNPDDPTDENLYRQNQYSPWEVIDPHQGVLSQDNKVAVASAIHLHAKELKDTANKISGLRLQIQNLRTASGQPETPEDAGDEAGPATPTQAIMGSSGLSEKAKKNLLAQKEALSAPAEKPKPVTSWFGENKEATAQAMADWQKAEDERQSSLNAVTQQLDTDSKIKQTRQQLQEAANRQQQLKEMGPAGYLQEARRTAAGSFPGQIGAMAPEDATATLAETQKNLSDTDAQLSQEGESLKKRIADFQAKRQQGGTAQQIAELDKEGASIQADQQAYQQKIAGRNEQVQQLQAGQDAYNQARQKEQQAARDQMKLDPITAPAAGQLDQLDQDYKQRSALIQGMDPSIQDAAKEMLDADNQQKKQAVQVDILKRAKDQWIQGERQRLQATAQEPIKSGNESGNPFVNAVNNFGASLAGIIPSTVGGILRFASQNKSLADVAEDQVSEQQKAIDAEKAAGADPDKIARMESDLDWSKKRAQNLREANPDNHKPLQGLADAAKSGADYLSQLNREYQAAYGVDPTDKSLSAQIGKGAGGFVGTLPAMAFSGPAGIVGFTLQGASQAYSEGYDATKSQLQQSGVKDEKEIEDKAQEAGSLAAAKSFPALAAYMVGGKLTSAGVASLFKDASPLVKGVVGTAGATASNMAIGSASRAIQGEDWKPSTESTIQDALWGLFHGYGEYKGASQINALKQKYNLPENWNGKPELLMAADQQIDALNTSPATKDLVKQRNELFQKITADPSQAEKIGPQIAALNQQIRTEPVNVAQENRTDLASALLKISQGVEFQNLTETERAAVGKAKTSAGVPFIEDHEGKTVITDTAKAWLSGMAPHAAEMLGATGQAAKDAISAINSTTSSDENKAPSQQPGATADQAGENQTPGGENRQETETQSGESEKLASSDPDPLDETAPLSDRKERAATMWKNANPGDVFHSPDPFGNNYVITIDSDKEGNRIASVKSPNGDHIETFNLDANEDALTKDNALLFGSDMVRVGSPEEKAGEENQDPPAPRILGKETQDNKEQQGPLSPQTKRGTMLSKILQSQGVEKEVADHYAGLREASYPEDITNEELRQRVMADFESDGGVFPKHLQEYNEDPEYWKASYPGEAPEKHQQMANDAIASNQGKRRQAEETNRKLLDLRPEEDSTEKADASPDLTEAQEKVNQDQVKSLLDQIQNSGVKVNGKPITVNHLKAIAQVLTKLQPEIAKWNDAFSKVVFSGKKLSSGGVLLRNSKNLEISLGDLMDGSENVKTILEHPSRASLLVSEEAIHALGYKMLADQAIKAGRSRESIIKSLDKVRAKKVEETPTAADYADAEAADLFNSLPKDLQSHVEGIYSEKPGQHAPYQLGHEFLRMLAQHDLAVDKNGNVHDGSALVTEQSLPAKIVAQIKNHLASLFSYLSKLADNLRASGASEKTIASVEEVRGNLREAIKSLRSQVDAKLLDQYREKYDQISRSQDTNSGGVAKQGEEPSRNEKAATNREGLGGTLGGVSGGPSGGGEAESLRERVSQLEAEKAEREAEKARAEERKNRAAEILAEKTADTEKIAESVPADVRPQAEQILSQMHMGEATYVLGANREKIPAAYFAAPLDRVEASHVGEDFQINPNYGGENTRPYHSDETEQNKVRQIALPGALDEDSIVSDVKSAADGPPQYALTIFNDKDGNPQVKLQAAGGNGRLMGIKLAPAEDQERLSDLWKSKESNFGLQGMPEGWMGGRFLGVYDLRDPEQAKKYQQLVDKLNPSQGVVQDTASRADIDAALKIPAERLVNLPVTMSPEQARTALIGLIKDSEKLGLDRNLMAGLVKNPTQAQFYMQRLVMAAAFHSKPLSEFFTSERLQNGHATMVGLLEASSETALRLREAGRGDIADALGRALENIADYSKRGEKIGTAIRYAADQMEMGKSGPIMNMIARALEKKVEYFQPNKKGIKPVDSESTIEGFKELMRDIGSAVERFSNEGGENAPDLLGNTETAESTIQRAIAAHEAKVEKSETAGELSSRRAQDPLKRMRQLLRKRSEEGLNQFEQQELVSLEKKQGQEFMGFFDETKPAFSLESEEGSRPVAPTSPADQLALLSRRSDDSESVVAGEKLSSLLARSADTDEYGFYSKMGKTLEAKIQGKAGTADQIKALITKPDSGIKPDEVKWTGILPKIDELAEQNGGKVPKDTLMQWLRDEGRVQFQETTLGEPAAQQAERDAQQIAQKYGFTAEYDPHSEEYTFTSGEGEDLDFQDLPSEMQTELVENTNKLDRQKSEPKYKRYSIPGGENYREVVLSMPGSDALNLKAGMEARQMEDGTWNIWDKDGWVYREGSATKNELLGKASQDEMLAKPNQETYRSSHFPSIPNYVAHMRLDERKDADGRPGLFIEEIQSDRHQKGREKGYQKSIPEKGLPEGYEVRRDGPSYGVWNNAGEYVSGTYKDTPEESIAAARKLIPEAGIPDAPFRKDWSVQMFKRALRDAIASGKEWIGWTSGDTQAERYDLSKQVDALKYVKRDDGTYKVQFIPKGRNGEWSSLGNDLKEAELSDNVGKEIAEKIANGEGEKDSFSGATILRGLDLKVGGEGMKGFYDQILPKEVGKYVKQWGGRVEQFYLDPKNPATRGMANDDEKTGVAIGARPIWKIDITPEMRNSVQEGQALFSRRANSEDSQGDLFEHGYTPDLFASHKQEIEAYNNALEKEGITDPETKAEAAMRDLDIPANEAMDLFSFIKPDGEEAPAPEQSQPHSQENNLEDSNRQRLEAIPESAVAQLAIEAGQRPLTATKESLLANSDPSTLSKALDSIKAPAAEAKPGSDLFGGQSTPSEIKDFGEKIEGARKDSWKVFSDAISQDLPEKNSDITLSKNFPEPDYEKLIASGFDPNRLAAMKALRDMIPRKPSSPYKLARWGEVVRAVHEAMRSFASPDSNVSFEFMMKAAEKAGSKIFSKVLLYKELGYPSFLQAKDWSIDQSRGVTMWDRNGNKIVTPDQWLTMAEHDGRTTEMRTTNPDRLAAFKEIAAQIKARIERDSLTAGDEPTKQKKIPFNIYRDRQSGELFIGKKGLTSVLRIKAGFSNLKDARDYLANSYDELAKIWEGMKTQTTGRNETNAPREGKLQRPGDVSPEAFNEAFGFRGVQFGNYVENTRRQTDLNHSFDALMDLASALGIPPRALSLDGQLGLAFGARGKGGKNAALAHYEPSQVVINLTKGGGPGTLAHEWFHALDNYFARLNITGKTDWQNASPGYASDQQQLLKNVRPEVWQAFNALKDALKEKGFTERSKQEDETRSKPYWNTTIEKAARAFEQYAKDRLAEKGISNDYLANIEKGSKVYPTPEEMKNGIRQAFDGLFEAMDTRETDRGTALYSRGVNGEREENNGKLNWNDEDSTTHEDKSESPEGERQGENSGPLPRGIEAHDLISGGGRAAIQPERVLEQIDPARGAKDHTVAPSDSDRARNQTALIEWARDNNRIISPEAIEGFTRARGIYGGTEHQVYFTPRNEQGESFVIKEFFNKDADPFSYLKRQAEFNAIVPSARIDFLGVSIRPDGTPEIWVRQPFIEGRHPELEEILPYLHSQGWELRYGPDGQYWEHSDSKIRMHDVTRSNFIKPPDRDMIPFDVRFSNATTSDALFSRGANDENQLELDFDKAAEDGQKTPAERLRESEPLINQQSALFSNTPGYDRDEARQVARIAVAKAAKSYDPERGVPFQAYARQAVRNTLRDLYNQEKTHADRYQPTLNNPAGADYEESQQDHTADLTSPNPEKDTQRNEARALLDEGLSTLPERMQAAVNGALEGKNGEEIAKEMGISRQAVNNLQKAAYERLKKRFAEKGITNTDEILSRSADAGEQGIDDFMDHLDGLVEKAKAEENSGKEKKIGSPDRAYGAASPEHRAVDEYYDEKATPETRDQWEAAAQDLVKGEAKRTINRIQSKALNGETLTPEETIAAGILADRLRRKMVADPSDENKAAFYRFWNSYRMTGTAAGRAMASRVDPYMTPAQRYRNFLVDLMTKPGSKDMKAIDAEKDPEKKAAMIDAETKRLLDKLAAAGITPEDILNDRVTLRLAEKKILNEFRSMLSRPSGSDAKKAAFDMILANKSLDHISKMTGLKPDEIQGIKDQFVAKMRADHFAKFEAGAKADQATLITGNKVSKEQAEAEFQKWMRRLGVVPDAEQGKPKFNIEDPAHIVRMTRAIQEARGEADKLDMALEAWKMGLLSGPHTHIYNFLGHAGNAVWSLTAQRGMEALVNLAARDQKAARFGEFKYLAKGLFPGIAKGYQEAMRSWGAEHDFFENSVLGTPLELEQVRRGVMDAPMGKIPEKIKIGNFTLPLVSGSRIRIPGRAVLFADALIRNAVAQMEAGTHAYRIARAEGLSGKALSERVEQLVKTRGQVVSEYMSKVTPTDEMVKHFANRIAARDETINPDDLVADKGSDAWSMAREQIAYDAAKKDGWKDDAWRQAVDSANEIGFKQELKTKSEGGNTFEHLAAKIQDMRQEAPLLNLIFPFVKTPYNIMRIGVRRAFGAPALAYRATKGIRSMAKGEGYLAGHETAVRDYAEQVLTLGLGALLWGAIAGDKDDDSKKLLITGSAAPKSREDGKGFRDLEDRAYGGSYVIRVGGRDGVKIPFGRLEPLGTVLGSVVDTVHALKSNSPSDEQLHHVWSYLTEQVRAKSFLQGMNTIMELADASREATPISAIKKTLLQAFVPNIIRDPLRSTDDTVREGKTAPTLYTSLPTANLAQPKLDAYGEEVKKSGNPISRMFFLTALATPPELKQSDKLLMNWNRENPSEAWAPQAPKAVFKGADGKEQAMTAEETTKFRKAAGQLVKSKLAGIVNSRNADHPRRDDFLAVKKAFEEAGHEAKQRIFTPAYIARRKPASD